MILGLEIGLIVAGLIVLVTGKFKLGKDRIATGAAARIAGAVFLLPFPVAFAIGFIIALVRASEGKSSDSADLKLTLGMIELGVCIVCALLGFGIALASAVPVEQAERQPESIDKRETPTSAEEPILVFPVEDRPEAIRPRASGLNPEARPRPLLTAQARPLPSIPARRPEPATSADSSTLWWVIGGLAVVVVICFVSVA